MLLTQNPQLIDIQQGSTLKVHQVKGAAGSIMSDHFSTLEALVIIRKGKAKLFIGGKEIELLPNSTFIIPAGQNHSLTIMEDLVAWVVMPVDSEIHFN